MNPQVGGAAPKALGIYRLLARMITEAASSRLSPFRLLSRRSGCVPAVPYPPLRSFQSGLLQSRRAMIYQRTAVTPLTLCLTPGVQFNDLLRSSHPSHYVFFTSRAAIVRGISTIRETI